MATPYDVRQELITAVDAVAGSRIAGSDFLRDVALPTGDRYFQVRVDAIGLQPDSNVSYQLVQCEVTVASDVGASESDAELQALLGLQASLTTPEFFRGLAAVRDVVDGPQVTQTMERVGNVLSFVVRCDCTVKP